MSTAAAQPPPLSWREARQILRKILEDYASDAPIYRRRRRRSRHVSTHQTTTIHDSSKGSIVASVALRWCEWDLDVLVGCLGSSIALLILATLAFSDSNDDDDDDDDNNFASFARSQLAGSILVLLGCFLNMWLVARYRYSASQGTDGKKRRIICSFLRQLNDEEKRSLQNTTSTGDNGIDLVGTSLTDIYPVYRIVSGHDKNQPQHGSWSRLPTLLLVAGDRIALQVGDIAPAKCQVLGGNKSSAVVFETGDKIMHNYVGENTQAAIWKWPRGRTTFPADSDELLQMCNDMRIFEVLETPIKAFLREPERKSKSPQVLRQLDTIRGVLSLVGIAVFILSLVVLLGRSWHAFLSSSDNRRLYYLLPTPFLAALSAFAFIGPFCLIFIESLGTARILASYHPVASRTLAGYLSHPEKPNLDVLILRYFFATLSNCLSLQDFGHNLDQWMLKNNIFGSKHLDGRSCLVRVPPSSLYLLEKLGVATAFTLIDDELVCEPQAVPQQLLIPSGKGLKLLDICPAYESDSDDEDGDDLSSSLEFRRARQRSFDAEMNYDSDSDSDEGQMKDHHLVPHRRKPRRRLLRRTYLVSEQKHKEDQQDENSDSELVQFEDPAWWQQLPSLKCIGLACLLVEQKDESTSSSESAFVDERKALVQLVSKERRSMQLRALSHCIGFSTQPSYLGNQGDVSPFTEKHRLHVVSASMVRQRLKIDTHERGSEDSRWWGLLRADSTSVVVQDSRSGAYQLLTVGDPKVVTRMCHEAWQGENSTILPLAAQDRGTVLETSDNWKLADLDVEAFSYAPIPHTFEARCVGSQSPKFYLLDNDPRSDTLLPYQKDKQASAEWNLLNNQIFLGMLGSLVTPRPETQGLLSTLQDAGVRFVYFSPRNMRRQKEIASQMGIDVAWNCAISLRPLDQGEEDTHRMVSDYADWDVNAKLPHGIDSVQRHLKDVDNVPLLVSLFTDVTKTTTMQMIDIFQEYNDTVIAVGLSHLPRNSKIFSAADLAIGVDALSECMTKHDPEDLHSESLLPSEICFAAAISAHNCAFTLAGVSSIEHMPTILAQGRASFAASVSASIFLLSGFLSFAFFVVTTLFSVSTSIPYVPIMGAFMYLQVVLPLIAIPMAMSDPNQLSMTHVPPKNDAMVTFGKNEKTAFFGASFLKAAPAAVFAQLCSLIAFGELIIEYEPEVLRLGCPPAQSGDWTSVIRCPSLSSYSGVALDMAANLGLAELILCTIVASASFVYRTQPIWEEPPWRRNHVWVVSVGLGILIVAIYLFFVLERGAFAALPWYYFFLAYFIMPVLCVFWNEMLKWPERKVLDRAEKLRRLQFETRLGMWSPK